MEIIKGMAVPPDKAMQQLTKSLILNGHSDRTVNKVAKCAKVTVWNDLKLEDNKIDERI